MRLIFIALLVAAVTGSAHAQEKPAQAQESKDLLQEAQGVWERDVIETPDPSDRMVKTIEGNKETFSVYRGDGLVYQHKVDFEIDVSDRVTIFTFRNLKVTAGAQAGRTQEGEFSYLFQIRDDKWVEVQGLMNDDEAAPKLTVYERVDAEG